MAAMKVQGGRMVPANDIKQASFRLERIASDIDTVSRSLKVAGMPALAAEADRLRQAAADLAKKVARG